MLAGCLQLDSCQDEHIDARSSRLLGKRCDNKCSIEVSSRHKALAGYSSANHGSPYNDRLVGRTVAAKFEFRAFERLVAR